MRTLVVSAFVLLACGPSRDRPERHDAPSATQPTGPDPIVLRIPRSGGVVRAYLYPALDSVIWTSTARAAAPAGVLAFDREAGAVAYVDRSGLPKRIDLRLGTVGNATRAKLASLSSSDARAIYGIGDEGVVTRLTPTGDWTFTPPERARLVLPQQDGSLVVVTDRDDELGVYRIRPPEDQVLDTAAVPADPRVVHAQAADRIYFGVDSTLHALRVRDLTPVPAIQLAGPIRALSVTPSGDRVFVALDTSSRLVVVDRYRDEVTGHIELPGQVRALRMDPLGRYLLARPAVGDSAWVVAVGTARVIGSVESDWRDDLPFVAPDGAIALAADGNVVFVDGETLRPRQTVEEGADEYWHFIMWNGFRPRSAELDQPVTFESADAAYDSTSFADDSLADTTAVADTQPVPAVVPRTPAPRPAPPRAPTDSARRPPTRAAAAGWTVSFATLLSESSARELASSINVDGQAARVVRGQTAGTTIYRVVLGPYSSRAEAERVGRESRKTFWVFEGNP